MSAYAGFAAYYDTLMDDFDYPKWAEYYLKLIAQKGIQPTSLCDCACGTGSLTVEFAKRVSRVTGVDLSGDMLEIAQEKSRRSGVRVMFVHEDMTKLALPRPVDCIVCGCDGVNYLTSDAAVTAFFKRAHASLRTDGVLAFDISSPYKLEQVLGNNFFGEEREEIAYLWQNRFDSDTKTVHMNLTFFARESDGRYRRFSETHVQRAHDPNHLVELLNACGFTDISVFGDRTFDEPRKNELRIHFVARRDERGNLYAE